MNGKKVLFATSSSTIDRQSYELLNTLAEGISRCEKNIQVSGHTDSRGAADMNMKLSQARAESVLKYLESRGVGRSVIRSRGYGETSPIANNNSAEGRRLNRRIQFTILK
jgi:OOP family OmpA-OmpF porin